MSIAEPKTLARPYAVAAYEFARQSHQLDAWLLMLTNIRTLVLTQQIQNILNEPAIDAEVFLHMLEPFTKKALNQHGLNFLKLLIQQHRLVLAPVISDLFQTLKSQDDKVVALDITTAIALSDDQQAQLLEKMVRHLQKKISPTFCVDEKIIAGSVIRVGDEYVLDASLKAQLERLKTKF